MRTFLLLALFAIINPSLLSGQQLDNNFHSPVSVRASYITSLVKQPDGNILVGGEIAYHGNIPTNNLIRIRPDGTLDTSFSFASVGEYYVHDLDLSETGDIAVLLRKFGGYKNLLYSESKILVLDGDGSVKRESNTVTDASTIAVQNDGKILVGGDNTSRTLTRYNEDLSEDNLFNTTVSVNDWVRDIKIEEDKIFLAGQFDTVNGFPKHNIVKLNLDGSIDNTFDTGAGTPDGVGSLTIMPDGKILPGLTYINEFDGHQRRGNVRLNPNGSVDETFGIFPVNGPIGESVVTNDGIYVCAFIELNSVYGTYLFRLKEDGSRDYSFEPVMLKGIDSYVVRMIQVEDQLIISSPLAIGNVYGLSQVDNTGTLNPDFSPKISRLGTISFGDWQNDKIIVSGDFVRIDSVNTFGMARLNDDGTVDESFSVKVNYGAVLQMKLLEDENTLITTGNKFFKVDNVGNIKPDFNWSPRGFLYQVNKFQVIDSGKIMVGDANTLTRLHSDGSFDENFDLGHSSSSTAFGFDMQGDSIIYGFSVYDDQLSEFVTRVNRITPEAAVDTTFRVGDGPQKVEGKQWTSVTMVKVLDNKEILIGGYFGMFDDHIVSRGLVKLSPDGKLDEIFNANQTVAPGPFGFFDPQVEQIGSKIYIKGDYSIYVINIDGTVDAFEIPATVEGLSDIIAVTSDEAPSDNGRAKSDEAYIIALGSFQNTNSNTRLSLLKLKVNRSEVVTGIGEINHEPLSMEVYPQPTSGILNIRFDNENSDFRAAVYSLSGGKFMEHSFTGKAGNEVNSLDVSQIPPGFYMLKVVSKSGKTGYLKFVRVP